MLQGVLATFGCSRANQSINKPTVGAKLLSELRTTMLGIRHLAFEKLNFARVDFVRGNIITFTLNAPMKPKRRTSTANRK